MIEPLFFVSMGVGAVLGFVIGFYVQYRLQKRHRDLPSMDDCISGGVAGVFLGAVWWATIPSALLLLVWVSLVYLIKKALLRTGKFSE